MPEGEAGGREPGYRWQRACAGSTGRPALGAALLRRGAATEGGGGGKGLGLTPLRGIAGAEQLRSPCSARGGSGGTQKGFSPPVSFGWTSDCCVAAQKRMKTLPGESRGQGRGENMSHVKQSPSDLVHHYH